jgi:hypothetical protein
VSGSTNRDGLRSGLGEWGTSARSGAAEAELDTRGAAKVLRELQWHRHGLRWHMVTTAVVAMVTGMRTAVGEQVTAWEAALQGWGTDWGGVSGTRRRGGNDVGDWGRLGGGDNLGGRSWGRCGMGSGLSLGGSSGTSLLALALLA